MLGAPKQRPSLVLAVLAIAIGLVSAPAAMAQEQGPIALDVQQVKIPATRAKLVRKGVQVRATCTPDCLLVVKLVLPKPVARKLGLKKRVIGSAIAVGASGQPVSARARIRRGVRGALLRYRGDARMRIRIRAVP
jgi:hypothetical protein